MKRTVIAFIIFAVILSLCILDAEYMRKTSADMLLLLADIRTACDMNDNALVLSLSQELDRRWEDCHPIYCVLNYHEELEQACSGIKRINEYAMRNDTESIYPELASTISVITNISDMHRITLENVF